jgi:uncharacterized protein (TIGR02646 family)
MIQVNRTHEPTVLKKNASAWSKKYISEVNAYIANPNPANKKRKEIAEKRYNHQKVKNSLKCMFEGKCAYCESHVGHIDYPHIEHYRPKSKFPALCFDWNNLLLGCTVCNGIEFKGDKFPEIAEDGPLVNPVNEDPNNFFLFEFDEKTGTANVIEKNPRGKTTKDILGLNRPLLVRHRSDIVRLMAFIAIKASKV